MVPKPEVIRQLVKEWLESGEDEFPDELTSALQDPDWFAVGHRGVCERYASGGLEVRFDFLVEEIGGERCHYRAIVNKSVFELGNDAATVRMSKNCPSLRANGAQDKRAMLVYIRQLGELPQRVVLPLALVELVGLECGHQLERLHGYGVEFLERNRLVQEVVLCQADGELGFVSRLGTVPDAQLVRDVIERPTQVVDNITDDRGQIERWLFENSESDPWFAVARVALHDESVRATVNVSSRFVVKGYEMVVGAPEFLDDTS